MKEHEIFIEALTLSAKARLAYLDRVCGDDLPLRVRLDESLAKYEVDFPLLDASAAELNAVRRLDDPA